MGAELTAAISALRGFVQPLAADVRKEPLDTTFVGSQQAGQQMFAQFKIRDFCHK